MIHDLLARHGGLPSRLLRLELTESAVMQDQFRAVQILRAVRELGTELHMDDFGVGYSSLGLLKQLPFDVIKLDRSFIVDLLEDSESALLTRAIVNVAHSLKRRVIAEGSRPRRRLLTCCTSAATPRKAGCTAKRFPPPK